MASSSSSSSSSSFMAKTYDVFVSFRGADIRYTLLSHLQDAFDRNGIITFVDEDLERGEEITSSLLDKIEDSYVSVVIFSEKYAFSAWCLDELVKIVDCKNNMGQIVIPVFYRVDPTDVQELSGNFGAAIAQHRNDFKDCLDKVQTWSHALKEIAELSGLASHPTKPDSKLIDEIINHTLEKLLCLDHHSNSDNSEGLVGIDYRIKCVEPLLCLSSSKVQIVGIWGMGGIGKSTLAKKVYHRIKSHFTFQCFVENVRERCENGKLNSVQNEIFRAIFGPTIANRANCTMLSPSIVQGLKRRKVCLALDDVSDIMQIENSIGKLDIFGPWSIVIIISRDKQLLRFVKAEIYEVKALDHREGLHLFCLHAFNQSTPKQDYATLSRRAVNYAQGNPLGLKVLGSNLYSRSVEEWEDELQKLEAMPNNKIGKILRASYDALDEIEKEIFLFIACFFSWANKDHALSILDMVGSKIGIRSLCDKSLVSITENCLCMHDLLKQMGKDIACEEKELRKRKILWRHEDIRDLLTNDEGTGAIKGISLDMSKTRDIIELKPATFGRQHNLIRYLKFHNSSFPELESINKVHVVGGLICLPRELRLLQWDGYPLKSLPSNSFLENLVELHMPRSEIEELWSGVQELGNLRIISLWGARMLSRLPDFSKNPKVKILDLYNCVNLRSLPQSICNLECLEFLDVSNCIYLHKLPNDLGKLKSLKMIRASGINKVPSSFNQLRKSPWICSVESEGVIFPCLYTLELTSCGILELPNSLCSLVSLEELDIGGNDFESIPETIKQLSNLKRLHLRDCKRLQYLPELPLLNYLNLTGCTSLKSVFASSQLLHKQQKLEQLALSDCFNLNEEEYNQIIDYAISSYPYKDNQFQLCIPGSEVPQKIKYKNKSGCSLSFSFSYKQLEDLTFCFCVVFDPKFSSYAFIRCEAIFMDELGHKFHALVLYSSFYPREMSPTDGTHLLLWHESCYPQIEVGIGGPCAVHFNFSNFDGCHSIMGCGVHPLFEDNNDDKTEEEELPLKKLKHTVEGN